jgi:hypothetical protein
MDTDPDLKMVSLVTTSTLNHATKCMDKCQITKEIYQWAKTPKYDQPGCRIVPLLFWYDTTHIASVQYY